MEFLNACECFEFGSGGPQFLYTKVLWKEQHDFFCAKSPHRNTRNIPKTDLRDIVQIPPEAYRPPLPQDSTVASHSNEFYIKQPDLLQYNGDDDGLDLNGLVLRDLATCEILRRHPHPNLATYYGCTVIDGRVSGLCFKKYRQNLQEKLNPGSLSKEHFIQDADRAGARASATRYLPGIEAGLRHLHQLGIAHNDMNPANVMIDEDDTPIIIDFDSSNRLGEKLGGKGGTPGWCDPSQDVSDEQSDLDALDEIRLWLSSSSPEDFKFKI